MYSCQVLAARRAGKPGIDQFGRWPYTLNLDSRPEEFAQFSVLRIPGSGMAMLNRISAIWKRLGKPAFMRSRPAFFAGVQSSFGSPGRLLVSALLGIVGVAAAATIASFASGPDGAKGVAIGSAPLSQPLAGHERIRSGWLTLAIDGSLPETLLQSVALPGRRSGYDRSRRRAKKRSICSTSRATPMYRSAWLPERSRPKARCTRASWRRLRPSPRLRMMSRWRS